MKEVKRVFLIVLDSFGCGELPDAADFGDEGSNTLKSVSSSPCFDAPNLTRLGLFDIDGTGCKRESGSVIGAYGKANELSKGKDTIIGHWEISGLVSDKPMPVYPNGFSRELLDRIELETGIGAICNKSYSGTQVIHDYGREHIKSGKMIVYTSADSVYQAAAHEDVIPIDKLYEYCEKVRKIMSGENAVGRIIARPFVGEFPSYERTANRHDFSLEPSGKTMLDLLSESGIPTVCIGKISDIFAGSGVSEGIPTVSNADGMKKTAEIAQRDFCGLCFVNLVDFDMKYGHRNDIDGYAKAISEFDKWLGGFMNGMKEDDLLIITADHGCDPHTASTDHSREYVPVLAYAKGITPKNIGVRDTYADIGKTVCDAFGVKGDICGESFLSDIETVSDKKLAMQAIEAMKKAYAPYSMYQVGAALLCGSGKIYTGCNIESAVFTPTSCAERTALVKAVSEGERKFLKIAIAGGKNGSGADKCPPCGVCRQMLYEFGGDGLEILLADSELNITKYSLKELLPLGFSAKNLNN